MRAVLDTSVVIATDVGPLPGELAISAVTLAELHVGVLVAKEEDVRAERLRRLSVLHRRFARCPWTRRWPSATAGSPQQWYPPVGGHAPAPWTCSSLRQHTPMAPACTPATPTT